MCRWQQGSGSLWALSCMRPSNGLQRSLQAKRRSRYKRNVLYDKFRKMVLNWQHEQPVSPCVTEGREHCCLLLCWTNDGCWGSLVLQEALDAAAAARGKAEERLAVHKAAHAEAQAAAQAGRDKVGCWGVWIARVSDIMILSSLVCVNSFLTMIMLIHICLLNLQVSKLKDELVAQRARLLKARDYNEAISNELAVTQRRASCRCQPLSLPVHCEVHMPWPGTACPISDIFCWLQADVCDGRGGAEA